MKSTNMIPMPISTIGQQPQFDFDIGQAILKRCECGYDLFDKVARVSLISKMALGNRTGKDIPIEHIIYICRSCGQEVNVLPKVKKPDPT